MRGRSSWKCGGGAAVVVVIDTDAIAAGAKDAVSFLIAGHGPSY